MFADCARACAVAAQTPPNKLEADLAKAKRHDRDPSSVDNAIWLGRRLAYLAFSEAIDTFTQGILKHPGDARRTVIAGIATSPTRRFESCGRRSEKASQLIAGRRTRSSQTARRTRRGFRAARSSPHLVSHSARTVLSGDFTSALAATGRHEGVARERRHAVVQRLALT